MTGRPLRDENGELAGRRRRLPRHHPAQEIRAAGWRRSTRRRACWPRPTRRPRPTPRSSKPSARGSTGTSVPSGESTRIPSGCAVRPCGIAPTVSAPEFEALTRKLAYERGVGLAGPCLGRRPARLDSGDCPRRQLSPPRRPPQEDGLHSAFAVPIVLRGECLGVLEFFSREVAASRPRHPGNDEQPGHPDRSVHRAASNACPRHSVREAGLARDALGRRGPRDQQPTGIRLQQPGGARARCPVPAHAAGDLREGRREPGGNRARAGAAGEPPRRRIRPDLRQGQHGKDPAEHAARSQASGRHRAEPPRIRPPRPGRGRPGRHS